MKFCPAQCLSGEIDAAGKQASMHYDMAACAELTQQFETVPQLLREAIETDNPEEREALLLGERNKVLWYRMTVATVGCLRSVSNVCGSARLRPTHRLRIR